MTRVMTPHEETWNAITHAMGLACGIAGAAVVVTVAARHGNAWQVAGCAIYAVTLVAAYAASTLSHVFQSPRLRHAFRIADQAAIFLFIAGSWTPVAFAWLHTGPWWILHILIWCIALFGFTSKAVFAHRVQFGAVSVALYLLLGFLPTLTIRPLLASLPMGLIGWLVAGGLCYVLGIVFFRLDNRIRYFHAVWHVAVIAGSTCHFMGILLFCTSPNVS